MKPLSLIVAIARGGVIGNAGALPWHIPEDLKHFRRVTTGHAILMGRNTHLSIGKPLPGRRNIVVSRAAGASFVGCETASSLETAIDLARTTDPEPCVIGGRALYTAALPLVTRIHLTEIARDVEGDAHFHLDRAGFRETERRAGEDPTVTYVTLER